MAVAGKVAITPKGEWNAQTAYTKLDLVFYDNASYVATKPSTGVIPTDESYWMLVVQSAGSADFEGIINGDIQVGNAKTLGGHEAEHFASAEDLNSIQSTSKATLSTEGWYRVAEYRGNANSSQGGTTNSCEITIKRGTSSYGGTYRLYLESRYEKQEFKVKCVDIVAHILTKIRYVIDTQTNIAYIEVYNTANSTWLVGISNGKDERYCWKAIDAVATSETVDGVTVTTTYDIPANASPVTNLDIGYLEKYVPWDDSWTSVKNVPMGVYRIMPTQMPSITDLPTNITRSSWLIKIKATDENVYFLHTPGDNSNKGVTWIGNEYGSSYFNWNKVIKDSDLTADLAKYLPLSGGKLTGNLRFEKADSIFIGASTSLNQFNYGIQSDGNCYFQSKNGTVFSSKLDGTNTFNGTASGNIAREGGGMITSPNITFFGLGSTGGNQVYQRFEGVDGILGHLGFNANIPVYVNTLGTPFPLLHTSNYTDYAADYEEGTFDLTLEGRTLSGYKYTKIGNFVYLSGLVPFNGEPLTIENTTVEVHGLPFGISSIAYIYFGDAIYTPSNKATDNLVNYVPSGTYFGIGGSGTTSFAVGTPCVLHAMYITD